MTNTSNNIKIMDMNIFQKCRIIFHENFEKLVIESYTNQYQNQVMVLGIKILMDEVDENNIQCGTIFFGTGKSRFCKHHRQPKFRKIIDKDKIAAKKQSMIDNTANFTLKHKFLEATELNLNCECCGKEWWCLDSELLKKPFTCRTVALEECRKNGKMIDEPLKCPNCDSKKLYKHVDMIDEPLKCPNCDSKKDRKEPHV